MIKLIEQNTNLNNYNFRARKRISKLVKKLNYTENIKTIWSMKDKIKELDHKILINEQQVRFNLITLINQKEALK